MKLCKLSSNKDTFHTIEFKEGLNLIIGKQANPDDTDKKIPIMELERRIYF